MRTILIIAHVSSFSALVPLALVLRKRVSLRIIWLVALLLACSFVFDMTALYLGTHKHNSYPVGNLFVFVEFIIFLLIYQKAFTWKNGVVYWSAGIFTLVFFVNYALIQGPFVHNSYTSTLISILLMVLSLLYFRFLLAELPETYAHRMPMIWINIAVLIYFSGNLFLFMLYNYFVSGIWTLHNILNITKNVLLFIAIWQSQRKINSISS